MNCGEFFKSLRTKVGLSQLDVSRKLGWETPQMVSNIERGISFYPKDSISDVAKMFKVPEIEIKRVIVKQKQLDIAKEYGIVT